MLGARGVAGLEHDMVLARLCDRLVALELGAVIAAGPPDSVLGDSRVAASYLGTASPLVSL